MHETSCSGARDCGMSDVYMLKSVAGLRDGRFKLTLCCCIIYHRFIVRFPMELDLHFTTFLLQKC